MGNNDINQSGIRQNTELANIFHQMASCYRYLGDADRFRVIAYEKASRTLQDLKDDISVYAKDLKTLDTLNGIGESIGEKIMEYLSTGKIETFEKLKKKVPQQLLELMDINSLGPATIKLLNEKLKIRNREELIEAIEAGRVANLKGFGAKRIENMKRGLKLFKEAHTRLLLSDAIMIAEPVIQHVQSISGVIKAEIAGSLRRKKETIGDIDIIATAEKKDWKKIISRFIAYTQTERILASGETKASILLKKTNMQIDLRLVHESEYGSALLYFTGSKEHNIALRSWAKAKGWKVNEYGIFDTETDRRLAGSTEKEIYTLFGMQFIPPELREMRGEIETARKNELPKLVEETDIRGDMQMHSTWSDGTENIETIARHVLTGFPGYEYIVMTDHSPSQRVAGGLQPEEFLKQFKEIDKVNKKLGVTFIKKGVEVDILSDGTLDLTDDFLQNFDWVVASIHSGFNKDNTQRLINACKHPHVHCIGHPSGRLIGQREAYPVNWSELFDTAASTGTAIEINAQPLRLDLRDDLVKAAIEKNVTITISTDSHSLGQFDFMSFGVAVARRGWCTRKNILNTFNWEKIQAFKKMKQAKLNKAVPA
ncbi:MAG TPA: DNA polymerase/3'-5' exonuclease PolX [Puia sp.]|nr:DNA polymerase/3'-5' exonuclease PolX [Puia sp.]